MPDIMRDPRVPPREHESFWETTSAPPYVIFDSDRECRSAEADGQYSTMGTSSESRSAEATDAYHIQTRLTDGRPALVVDPGSVGNLCGDAWARGVAAAAHRHGHAPRYTKRPRPLRVQGVGNGAQTCGYDCTLPIALRQKDGKSISIGSIVTPTVAGSDLPGLLGLNAMRRNRALLDVEKMELHFVGPGDYDLSKVLPPGSDTFQLELAPSGHLVLPCSEFSGDVAEDHSLTLVTRSSSRSPSTRVPPPPAAPPSFAASSSRSPLTLVPPPPGFEA